MSLDETESQKRLELCDFIQLTINESSSMNYRNNGITNENAYRETLFTCEKKMKGKK